MFLQFVAMLYWQTVTRVHTVWVDGEEIPRLVYSIALYQRPEYMLGMQLYCISGDYHQLFNPGNSQLFMSNLHVRQSEPAHYAVGLSI
jgi:hypothetical protein